MDFNTREISTGIWLAVIVIALISKRSLRASLVQLVRVMLRVKIALPALAMVIYIFVVVAILAWVGIWANFLLKDTIYWFMGVGLVLFAKAAENKSPVENWKKVAKEQISVIIILTFIINSYTFNLPIELVLVPLAVLIMLIAAIAEMNKENAGLARVFGWVQAVFGWFIFLAALGKAIQDYTILATFQSFQRLFLPFILTTLTLPFMYALALYAQYDCVFVLSAFNKPRKLTRYMRRSAIRYAGINLAKVSRLAAIRPIDLMRVNSPQDFDMLIAGLNGVIKPDLESPINAQQDTK